MEEARNYYQENGFLKLDSFLQYDDCYNLLNEIKLSIKKCADDLNCPMELYLQAVDTWVAPSPVTNIISQSLLKKIQQQLQNLFQKDVFCVKYNIRGKSSFFSYPTACHQDVSYSIKEPYMATTWLSLNKVTEESGALLFKPGSHDKVSIPVDYWHANFIDPYLTNPKLKQLFYPLPANPGDLIIFDSKVLHASTENNTLADRYAIICRWTSADFSLNDGTPIYNYNDFDYGTLTFCHALESTYDLYVYLIDKYFNKIDNEEFKSMPYYEFDQLIDKIVLGVRLDTDFLQKDKALDILIKGKILYQADKQQNAGDSTGVIYKQLWQDFILPILNNLNINYML